MPVLDAPQTSALVSGSLHNFIVFASVLMLVHGATTCAEARPEQWRDAEVAVEKTNAMPCFTRAYRTKSTRCASEAMHRKLVRIEEQGFRAWGCSECAWAFRPSDLPAGKLLNEMMQNYKLQCDNDFAAHVCAEHPRGKSTKG
jgi:hypothetical protein